MAEPTGHDQIRQAAAQAEEMPPALEVFNPSSLEGKPVPERKWAVKDWIPWGVVSGIYGDGGIGKTLAIQQLQTCMALGINWFGIATQPLRTLAIYCEDHLDELHRRQADINLLYGCSFKDVEAGAWLSRLGHDNILANFTSGRMVRTEFLQQVIVAAKMHGAQLVFVDTVSDTFAGNENDRGEVRQYIQAALGYMAREINGSVLACAHPSRAGTVSGEGFGGSTAWSNAFRSRLYLSAPADDKESSIAVDPAARILARKKSNYAGRSDEIRLRWESGVFVTDEDGTRATRERPDVDTVFLMLLDRFFYEDRKVSSAARSHNYAPRMFTQHPERQGYLQGDFIQAMNRLFARDEIEIKREGRASHPIEYIARKQI